MSDCFNIDVNMIFEKISDLHSDVTSSVMLRNTEMLYEKQFIEINKVLACELKTYAEYLIENENIRLENNIMEDSDDE